METKKSKGADLKSKQGVFLQIGFVVALGIVFAAFSYTTGEKKELIVLTTGSTDYTVELPPVTRMKEEKKLEPPRTVQIIDIIPDDIELEDDEIEIASVDDFKPVVIVPMDITEKDEEEVLPFFKVEEKPEFPGGDSELLKFLGKSTKYPELAAEMGIQGVVYVGFVIDKTGKVVQVTLLRGVDKLLDEEAMRVVRSMPNWKPGIQRTKPVQVAYQVPINFSLR